MTPGEFRSRYSSLEQVEQLKQWLSQEKNRVLHLKGLSGSSLAVVAACILQDTGQNHIFVLPDKETAAYFQNDLENFLSGPGLLFFPSSYQRSVQFYQKSKDQIIRRTEILKRISLDPGPLTIITYPEALVEKTVPLNFLETNAFRIRKGERLSMSFLSEFLESCRFQLVDFVYEPGQYALRGSILDVFSFSARFPYRIDFSGETWSKSGPEREGESRPWCPSRNFSEGMCCTGPMTWPSSGTAWTIFMNGPAGTARKRGRTTLPTPTRGIT
jgi:transcription-repair coupling factor (superfamily II helicase)